MRLGSSISVPAPNSAHLRREPSTSTQLPAKALPPFRTESINSSASNTSSFQVDSSNSERESISPSRIHEDPQVKLSDWFHSGKSGWSDRLKDKNTYIHMAYLLTFMYRRNVCLIGILWPKWVWKLDIFPIWQSHLILKSVHAIFIVSISLTLS